jgi:hypothetical protein
MASRKLSSESSSPRALIVQPKMPASISDDRPFAVTALAYKGTTKYNGEVEADMMGVIEGR